MMISYKCKLLAGLICVFLPAGKTFAQFSLIGQVRTRTELRDGLGTLALKDARAAAFTSQRTRLSFAFKKDRISFQTSVQDIRIWGQDASTISSTDGNRLMLHEAWGEIVLANKADTTLKFNILEQLSFRLGRQELLYDDSRLLGNLDWLQQARRHDAAVLKIVHKGWQIDLGGAFGQNTDAFGTAGTSFVPGNVPAYVRNSRGILTPTPTGLVPLSNASGVSAKNGAPVYTNPPGTNAIGQLYKSMQYLYLARKAGTARVSGLFFKDDFGRYRPDSVGNAETGFVYGRRFDAGGVNSRMTYGLLLSGPVGKTGFWKNVSVHTGAYAQSGKDKDGKNLSAWHVTAFAAYQIGKLSLGAGYDHLSGNKSDTPASENRRFDPLYGTPHKFWGLMDYFYVGTGSPAGGLANAYFKTKYSGKKSSLSLDVHRFSLANPLNARPAESPSTELGRYLGSEIDVIFNRNINKFIGIEAGYCFMAATDSLEYTKLGSTGKADRSPQWAYLMISIRPEIFKSADKG